MQLKDNNASNKEKIAQYSLQNNPQEPAFGHKTLKKYWSIMVLTKVGEPKTTAEPNNNSISQLSSLYKPSLCWKTGFGLKQRNE